MCILVNSKFLLNILHKTCIILVPKISHNMMVVQLYFVLLVNLPKKSEYFD